MFVSSPSYYRHYYEPRVEGLTNQPMDTNMLLYHKVNLIVDDLPTESFLVDEPPRE
jgi:hypothetical protein